LTCSSLSAYQHFDIPVVAWLNFVRKLLKNAVKKQMLEGMGFWLML